MVDSSAVVTPRERFDVAVAMLGSEHVDQPEMGQAFEHPECRVHPALLQLGVASIAVGDGLAIGEFSLGRIQIPARMRGRCSAVAIPA